MGSVSKCFKEPSKLTPGKTPKTKIDNKLLQFHDQGNTKLLLCVAAIV